MKVPTLKIIDKINFTNNNRAMNIPADLNKLKMSAGKYNYTDLSKLGKTIDKIV